MQFPKIIVISLKNSSRRAIISKRLLGLGLEFEFFFFFFWKTLPQEILVLPKTLFIPKTFNTR